jgi:hypothetical protein
VVGEKDGKRAGWKVSWWGREKGGRREGWGKRYQWEYIYCNRVEGEQGER